MTSTWAVPEVMNYFAHQPRRLCITCQQRLEARPGVRLCRSCLEVAAACFEAIKAEEAPALIVRPEQ